MSQLFDHHQLVHSNNEICDVHAQGNLEPSFEIATVGFAMINGDGEEHDEDTDS